MMELELYKKRLDDWKREKKYNEYGMQYLADRAIKLLEQEIEEIESAWKDCLESHNLEG